MNCDVIEKLLPFYHEGTLTDTERAVVTEHLASCPRCRESSAAFAALERMLVTRRNELPHAGMISDAVLARLGTPRKRFVPSPRWIAMILTGIFSVAVILAHIVRHESITVITERIETAYGAFLTLLTGMPARIAEVAGGELWILLTVYFTLTVGFAIAGRIVCKRIIEE
jgi:predicted anti-sigma-YlaC factor YlaD